MKQKAAILSPHMTKGAKMDLTYSETTDGFLAPNLTAPMETEPDIGVWGRRRKDYLQNHRKGQYTVMKTQGTLFSHLAETNREASAMFDRLVERLAKAQGVDNAMKQRDQMLWVGRMNNIRSQANETVLNDLIYC